MTNDEIEALVRAQVDLRTANLLERCNNLEKQVVLPIMVVQKRANLEGQQQEQQRVLAIIDAEINKLTFADSAVANAIVARLYLVRSKIVGERP